MCALKQISSLYDVHSRVKREVKKALSAISKIDAFQIAMLRQEMRKTVALSEGVWYYSSRRSDQAKKCIGYILNKCEYSTCM